MTRWLITGANGMLGQALQAALAPSGDEVVALAKDALDITDRDAVRDTIRHHRPEVIINSAAFTKVDDCETSEDLALTINGRGVAHLAEAANEIDALLTQVSTDFVFNGTSRQPYETSHPVEPLSAYGRTKLEGESAAQHSVRHIVLRTSWLFGEGGWNFVEAMRRQASSGRTELRVVNDQRGKPTYTPHLADALLRLSRLGLTHAAARGTFHYADEEECSWYDFAIAIFEELEKRGELQTKIVVHPVTTDEFPRPARRPAYSVLSTSLYSRVTGATPSRWRDGLAKYLGA